jgi:predicted esterase
MMVRAFRILALAFAGLVFSEPGFTNPAGGHYIFYLHGKIVEDQGRNAVSERFGPYEYDRIVSALGQTGAEVVSEVRKTNTDSRSYATQVAAEIRQLKQSGVPSRHITVIGASKGAAITLDVSHLLNDDEISYVLLAICAPSLLEYWARQEICPAGRVLSIYDASDESVGSCNALVDRCRATVADYREIVLDLGLSHGILYQPYDEWVSPVLEWAGVTE